MLKYLIRGVIMIKKTYLIGILIIILILILGVCIVPNLLNPPIKVGAVNFEMPEGYHEGAVNAFGAVNITNGVSEVFLLEHKDSNTNEYIDEYKVHINEINQTMDIINYTIDNVQVFKTDNKDSPETVHYWFVKDNKTYDIYTWDGNKDIDSIVAQFINS